MQRVSTKTCHYWWYRFGLILFKSTTTNYWENVADGGSTVELNILLPQTQLVHNPSKLRNSYRVVPVSGRVISLHISAGNKNLLEIICGLPIASSKKVAPQIRSEYLQINDLRTIHTIPKRIIRFPVGHELLNRGDQRKLITLVFTCFQPKTHKKKRPKKTGEADIMQIEYAQWRYCNRNIKFSITMSFVIRQFLTP